MSKVIVTDIQKCVACKTCEIACALEHSTSKKLEEAVLESPAPQSRVSVLANGTYSVPLQCRHCEDAPCIMVCPTRAMHRGQIGEPVLIDRELCIGCRACIMACPFGSIEMSRGGRAVVKCDLCIERSAHGQEPACVSSCPTNAMRCCDPRDVNLERRQQAAAQACAASDTDETP